MVLAQLGFKLDYFTRKPGNKVALEFCRKVVATGLPGKIGVKMTPDGRRCAIVWQVFV